MKKKLLCALLALCMVLTLLPFAAFAADDLSPYADRINNLVYNQSKPLYGTFFDFDGDDSPELVLVYSTNQDQLIDVYTLKTNADGEQYCESMFRGQFKYPNTENSDHLAAITVNEQGEAGLLIHSERLMTLQDAGYQDKVGLFSFDEFYTYRGGALQKTDSASFIMWLSYPDEDGNSVYYPDLSEFYVNGNSVSEEAYDAWFDGFTETLAAAAWLSPHEREDGLTKQELLTVMQTGFYDVPAGAYYAEPVKWAAANGITDGTADYEFSPMKPCTRGQVVTFLWRAAGSPEPESSENPFQDVKEGAYYYKAVLWAVEKGITDGTSETTFSPDNPCTRGHVVTFLHRNAGTPEVSAENPFKDVESDQYYYDAVLWAVENKITDGTSDTTFSPNQTCTRGQIVTFLYRDLA